MMSQEGASLEFIMRSGYTRHLTRIIGADMVQGSREHEGALCSGPLNVYDSGSQCIAHCSQSVAFVLHCIMSPEKKTIVCLNCEGFTCRTH